MHKDRDNDQQEEQTQTEGQGFGQDSQSDQKQPHQNAQHAQKPMADSAHPAPELSYQNFEAHALTYMNSDAASILRRAFEFAHRLHDGQIRKSGEPYIIHPIAVAEILCDLHMDLTSLVAALLHDVVEDTHTSVETIRSEFGEEVSQLVDGLTKLARVHFRSSQEKLAENFRKMVLAMSKDIRVIIIKLADRLHNMRTLRSLPDTKRQRIAQETQDIYAPLAGRLGIYRIKAELEDLCLKELKPSVYFSLVDRVAQKKETRERTIERTREALQLRLDEQDITCDVSGRAKHFFSIYKKMSERQIDFEDLYDLFGLRVIVPDVGSCYEALGIVHNLFRPVPGRFKDYIAMPKANLYQSLHTTIVAEQGELIEIQIRTREMHNIAENGIAAHWAYKEQRGSKRTKRPASGGPLPQKTQEELETFNWLKQIVSHQQELSDPDEFLDAVKVDLFDDEVYVFSPKGDVFELRQGSTCLDFAFAVHSDLGLRTSGAKINGRLCPLRKKLSGGDVVEVLSGKAITATKDWLNFVTTAKAKNKIRAFLRTEERNEAKSHGLEMLESEFSNRGFSFDKLQKGGAFSDVNRLFSVGGFDDLILQIGYGKIDARSVVDKITGQENHPDAHTEQTQILNEINSTEIALRKPSRARRARSAEESVKVQGMSDILVRIARCCEPLPGQDIIGFVSRVHGVTVHAADCKWALSMDPARRISVSWEKSGSLSHSVRLKITTHDKQGLLATVTKLVSTSGINIVGAEVLTTLDKRGIIVLKLQVESISQLQDVHQQLEALQGVIHVERLMS
jgi:guanosine-3',5'-bis(diphosphate) 3'-pyrophosphohydrolase